MKRKVIKCKKSMVDKYLRGNKKLLRMNYILDGHKAVPCFSTLRWAMWFETAERKVAEDKVGRSYVSTVFLGLDHNPSSKGPPLVFETMVFNGKFNEYQERYSTWDKAEEGHRRIVKMIRDSKKRKESIWDHIASFVDKGVLCLSPQKRLTRF